MYQILSFFLEQIIIYIIDFTVVFDEIPLFIRDYNGVFNSICLSIDAI